MTKRSFLRAPPHPQVEWQATLRTQWCPNTYCVTCGTFPKPVIEVLFNEATFQANCILKCVEPVKILMEGRMISRS